MLTCGDFVPLECEGCHKEDSWIMFQKPGRFNNCSASTSVFQAFPIQIEISGSLGEHINYWSGLCLTTVKYIFKLNRSILDCLSNKYCVRTAIFCKDILVGVEIMIGCMWIHLTWIWCSCTCIGLDERLGVCENENCWILIP